MKAQYHVKHGTKRKYKGITSLKTFQSTGSKGSATLMKYIPQHLLYIVKNMVGYQVGKIRVSRSEFYWMRS